MARHTARHARRIASVHAKTKVTHKHKMSVHKHMKQPSAATRDPWMRKAMAKGQR